MDNCDLLACPKCGRALEVGQITIASAFSAFGLWVAAHLYFRSAEKKNEIIITGYDIVEAWRCPNCDLALLQGRSPRQTERNSHILLTVLVVLIVALGVVGMLVVAGVF